MMQGHQQHSASNAKNFLLAACMLFSFCILLHSYYSRYVNGEFIEKLNMDLDVYIELHNVSDVSFERDDLKIPEHVEMEVSNNTPLDYSNINEDLIPWWDHTDLIQCELANERLVPQNRSWFEGPIPKSVGGHCGFKAFFRGNNQNVISYSIYGNNSEYWKGFSEILEDAKILYPDFIIRLYVNPRGKQDILCPLLVEHREYFDICDVLNLPLPLGNVLESDPKIWRTAPLGDPQVSRVLIRDSNSKLSDREVAAVDEWVESGLPLHIMRDHPSHNAPILPGMFGIYQTNKTTDGFEGIRKKLFNARGIDDQKNLLNNIPQILYRSSMQHDSFLCNNFPSSIPFPTKRENGFYVGSSIFPDEYKNSTITTVCPLQCRPAEYQYWIYC